ncbi:MAG: leucine-rich repeat domain-containing protein [Lachnospiraceae bacterium]|nr:leucine-rich repeat domain-containing protein [Lachnospiraceae bacterium]
MYEVEGYKVTYSVEGKWEDGYFGLVDFSKHMGNNESYYRMEIMVKKKLIAVGVLGIIVAVGVVCRYMLMPKNFSGVDSVGIAWEYNTGTRTLTLEKTTDNKGEMRDYEGGCEDADDPEFLPPWHVFQGECQKVVFGKGITSIGALTCSGFGRLSKVVFSNDVRKIGYSAFEECKCLKIITFPEKLQMIGASAFEKSGLKKVKLNKGLRSIEEWAFCESDIETIGIPETVERIGDCAFKDCEKLKNVTITGEMQVIGSHAFQGCLQLEKIGLPDKILTVEECLFAESGITEVCIPKNVTTVKGYVWRNTHYIERLRIEGTDIQNVSLHAFEGINSKVTVEVPKEKYDEYKEMLYTHGLPETAKVVAY